MSLMKWEYLAAAKVQSDLYGQRLVHDENKMIIAQWETSKTAIFKMTQNPICFADHGSG